MFDNDSVTNIAHQLGYFETIASVDVFGDLQLKHCRGHVLTSRRVARSVFSASNSTVGWFICCRSRDDNVTWSVAPLRFDKRCVLFAKRTRSTPSVTINIAVRAGLICDPAHATGAISPAVEGHRPRTATRLADDIAEALDIRQRGGRASSVRHLGAASDDFADVMALLGHLVQRPSCQRRSSRRGKMAFRVASSASAASAVGRGRPGAP